MNASTRVSGGALLLTLLIGGVSSAHASVMPLRCFMLYAAPTSDAAVSPRVDSARTAACRARGLDGLGTIRLIKTASRHRAMPTTAADLTYARRGDAADDGASDQFTMNTALSYGPATAIAAESDAESTLTWQSVNLALGGGGSIVLSSYNRSASGGAVDPRRGHPGNHAGSPAGGTSPGQGSTGDTDTTQITVNEPGTVALFGMGLLLFALKRLLPWWFRGAARWREKRVFPDQSWRTPAGGRPVPAQFVKGSAPLYADA